MIFVMILVLIWIELALKYSGNELKRSASLYNYASSTPDKFCNVRLVVQFYTNLPSPSLRSGSW